MKTLIVYGTRYGATTGNAEEIGRVLEEEGFDVRVANAKKEKIKNISEYDLVIVGSGMRMFRWVKEPEKFLKKFQKELKQKKLAIFISSGAQAVFKHDGDTVAMEGAKKKYLIEKAEQYALEPVSMAIFGGIWDYNNMGFAFKKTMGPFQMKLREAGIEETSPGVFDTRDWDEIRNWAKELALLVKS
ncbi:MAG: flavodoxin domain-containing protein [Candidatus Thorarchaeota archaeon]|jgi:menaquinone-dependent protoporphyrinogen oxidase